MLRIMPRLQFFRKLNPPQGHRCLVIFDYDHINVLIHEQEMENALETEIAAFRHDLHKMEASVRQLLMVANNQLKKVSPARSVF